MDCAYHAGVAAVSYCTACGRPICQSCRYEGTDVCPPCAAAATAAQAAVPAAQPSAPPPPTAPALQSAAPPPPPAASAPPPASFATPVVPPSGGSFAPPVVAAAPPKRPIGLYIGLGCGCLALLALLAAAAAVGYGYFKARPAVVQPVLQTGGASPAAEEKPVSSAGGEATPATTDSADPAAEARKVVELFVERDKAHDGEGMRELLGGGALKVFRADIQGQGDAETAAEEITQTEPVDDNNVKFQVKTVLRDLATGAENNVYDWLLVSRTDAGWKIIEIQYGE